MNARYKKDIPTPYCLWVLLPFESVHSFCKPTFFIDVQFQVISVEMVVINGIYNWVLMEHVN